jgi:hypothetical protein
MNSAGLGDVEARLPAPGIENFCARDGGPSKL